MYAVLFAFHRNGDVQIILHRVNKSRKIRWKHYYNSLFSFIQSELLVFFFIRIIATVTFWETLYYFWFYTSVHIHGCVYLILQLLQTFQQNTETSFTFNLKHIVRSKSLPSYRAEHYILGTHNIPHWKRKQLILIGDADKKKYIRNMKNGYGWKTHIISLLSVTCCYVSHIE